MALPIILYDNRFRDAVPTATDTATGSDVRFACDERAYTPWVAASAGVKYLTVDCGSSKYADCLAIIGHNFATGGIAVSVESSANGSSWTERMAPGVPATDRAVMGLFDRVSARYWRVKLGTGSAVPRIGEIAIGARLTFPEPPTAPFIPYTERIQAESTLGKAGHILGSVVHYKGLKISPRWTNQDRAWVLATFRPFWDQHASNLRPFFWSWDLEIFPTHVYFVTVDPGARYATPLSISTMVDDLQLDLVGVKELVEDAPYTPVYVAYTGGIPRAGSLIEATVSVSAGAMTATITNVHLTAACVLNPVPNWNTTVSVSPIVSGSCTVTFGTAAPAGGGTLYWSAVI